MLKVIMPLLMLSIIGLTVIVTIWLVGRSPERMRRIKQLTIQTVTLNNELRKYRQFYNDVTVAIHPDIHWGGEELLRERIRTLANKCNEMEGSP